MSAQAEIDDWIHRQLYRQKITVMNNTAPAQYKRGMPCTSVYF